MVATFLVLGIAGAARLAPPPVTLKGGVAIVQGILNDSPPLDTAPHNVHILVNGVNTLYNNVYIVSDGTPDYVSSGNPVLLVLQGSTPLIANFSQNAITVDQIQSTRSSVSQRTIPMSSGGQLQASFMMYLLNSHDGVQWTWPSFSLNSLSFPNGASGKWTAFPGLFDFVLPTAGVNTQQTMNFPSGFGRPYKFQFHASGAGSDLLMLGEGYTSPLTVSGTITGSNQVMVRANLDVSAGTP